MMRTKTRACQFALINGVIQLRNIFVKESGFKIQHFSVLASVIFLNLTQLTFVTKSTSFVESYAYRAFRVRLIKLSFTFRRFIDLQILLLLLLLPYFVSNVQRGKSKSKVTCLFP